jgi:hypothetical protein
VEEAKKSEEAKNKTTQRWNKNKETLLIKATKRSPASAELLKLILIA